VKSGAVAAATPRVRAAPGGPDSGAAADPEPRADHPHGVRVEGLDPDGLVTVLRALG